MAARQEHEMSSFLKRWLWALLGAISVMLVLMLPRDSLWMRAVMIAPALAGLALIARTIFERNDWRA